MELKKIFRKVNDDLLLTGSCNSATLGTIVKVLSDMKLDKNSVILDFGSGFGLPLITAAKIYGCKCIGIEYDLDLVRRSLHKISSNRKFVHICTHGY